MQKRSSIREASVVRDNAPVQPSIYRRRPRLLKGRRDQPGTRLFAPLVKCEPSRLPRRLVLALARLAAQPSEEHREVALVGEHVIADQAEQRAVRPER